MTTGTASEVRTGPGTLYVAALGTTEPASATASLSSWRDVGYTADGIRFRRTVNTSPVMVDQEFEAVSHATDSVESSIATNLAQINRTNLALALGVGAAEAATGTLEPPTPGQELRVMVLHQTDDGALWLFRKCFQVGTIEIASQKGANKRVIPVEFRIEKPDGAKPFKVYPSLTSAGVV